MYFLLFFSSCERRAINLRGVPVGRRRNSLRNTPSAVVYSDGVFAHAVRVRTGKRTHYRFDGITIIIIIGMISTVGYRSTENAHNIITYITVIYRLIAVLYRRTARYAAVGINNNDGIYNDIIAPKSFARLVGRRWIYDFYYI